MDDELLIRNKILCEERALKRLVTRFTTWKASQSALVKSDEPLQVEDATRMRRLYMQELSTYRLLMQKHGMMQRTHAQELEIVCAQQEKFRERLESGRGQIDVLQRELELARQERARKLEYDKVAKSIADIPSSQKSKARLALADGEIERLEGLIAVQRSQVELRKQKILHVAMTMESVSVVFEENLLDEGRIIESVTAEDEDEEVPASRLHLKALRKEITDGSSADSVVGVAAEDQQPIADNVAMDIEE